MIARAARRPTVDPRRQVHVDRIESGDFSGVPPGQRVYLASRIRCRDCGREVFLPAQSRGDDGTFVAYRAFAQRCTDHRRAYELPAVMPRVRDFQRTALYRWESRLPAVGGAGRWAPDARGVGATDTRLMIPFEECRDLVAAVWDDLMSHDPYPPPEVVLANRRWRTSSANADRIKLAPTMLHPMTVLHELAHSAIARWLAPGTYAAHGRRFASLYLSLLDEWLGLPSEVGRSTGESLRPRRLRFADSGYRPRPTSQPQLTLEL